MVNVDVFKTTVEEDLKEIKKCKIHILMIQEKNNELCEANNKEIERLNSVVENRELSLEENLSKSGEKKIDTSAGWCAYRVMPDNWEYDEKRIIRWCKDNGHPYFHTVEILEKGTLKESIKNKNFEAEDVPGLIITPQEPKFNYKLNGGL